MSYVEKVSPPDWAFWLASSTVQFREAIALSLDLDPDALRLSPESWEGGIPTVGALYEENCFPDDNSSELFVKRYTLLHRCVPGRQMRLSAFATWAVEVAKLDQIPPELAAMAPTVKIYVPLIPNLYGRWEEPLAELPSELRAIIEKWPPQFRWDDLDVATRRSIAAQDDGQSDPAQERVLYFKFANFVDKELKDRIEGARQEKDNTAVVVLRDVEDRINEILAVDRGQEGTKLQEWRADHDRVVELRSALAAKEQALSQANERIRQLEEKAPISREHVSDKLAKLNQAASKWWGRAKRDDRGTHTDNATVVAWLVEQGFSETLAEKAATIVRPEWAPSGRRPEE